MMDNPDIGMMAIREYLDKVAAKYGWSEYGTTNFLTQLSFENRYICRRKSLAFKFWKSHLQVKFVSLDIPQINLQKDIRYEDIDLTNPACFDEIEKVFYKYCGLQNRSIEEYNQLDRYRPPK